MTTTTIPTRSSSRPGMMITAVVGGSLVALMAVASLVAGDGDRAVTATTTDVRPGSADALERQLTPAAPGHHATADALERRLAAVVVERPHGTPDALERRLAPPAVDDAQSPVLGSADALERRTSR